MTGFYRYAIVHPKRTMIIALVVMLGTMPGVLGLTLRTDGHALIPHDTPEIQLDKTIRNEFGIDDPIVVLIETPHPHGIYNVETLGLVKNLSELFSDIEGVRASSIFSLASEYSDRVWPGTLNFRRFLDPLPKTDVELNRLRNDMRDIEIYQGTIVSYDENATAIMVGVPEDANRIDFYNTVRDIIEQHNTTSDRIRVIGAPVAESQLGTHILDDLGVPSILLGRHKLDHNNDVTNQDLSTLHRFRVWIANNIGLVPVALAIMSLVFFFSFRSIIATFLPLMEVGACLLFVFSLMGWSGTPVYLTTAVLPIILTAIGVADEIHIFARYRELLQERYLNTSVVHVTGHYTIIEETMKEMHRPIIKTSITTAIGFLSFALSPIAAVQAFGIFTAIGVMFCMVWSLTVIPAQLSIINPREFIRQNKKEMHRATWFNRFGDNIVRLRWVVLILSIGVVALLPRGIDKLYVQDSWIDGFAEDSSFYRTTQTFNDQFLGSHILQIRVEANHRETLTGEIPAINVRRHDVRIPANIVDDPHSLVGKWIHVVPVHNPTLNNPANPNFSIKREWKSLIEKVDLVGENISITGAQRHGMPRIAVRLVPGETLRYEILPYPFKQPEVLKKVDALEKFLATHKKEAVGGVLGPASYLFTTNYLAGGRKEEFKRLPDGPYRIDWLWKQYERARGAEQRQKLVNDDFTHALITVFLKNANFVDTQRFMDSIREYEEKHLAPHNLSLSFAGDVAVSQTLIGAIVDTQIRSLIGSLIGIFLITTLLGRSILIGIFSVLPCGLAVAINFAVMGTLAMPLGVATTMFVGMTLGIGVDFAIHLLERYRLSRIQFRHNADAIIDCIRATGPAIAIDAIAVAAGFGVMMLSQVPANARLGGLLVLSMINCLLITLVLLPVLLRIIYRNK